MNKVSLIQNFIIIACRIKNMTSELTVNKEIINKYLHPSRFIILSGLLTMLSCTGGKTGMNETPTRGNIKISVDESFEPLIDTEVYTFTHLYKNAKITPEYKPEPDVINDFMNDSVKVIVTSKKLIRLPDSVSA